MPADPGDPVRSAGLLGDHPVITEDLGTDVRALALTEEPAGGSARPTSDPLLQLALDGG
jgi:hypothetical protein